MEQLSFVFLALYGAIGIGAGILAGLLGVGGGLVIVPANAAVIVPTFNDRS